MLRRGLEAIKTRVQMWLLPWGPAWQNIGKKTGARFVPGRFWRAARLELDWQDWKIVLTNQPIQCRYWALASVDFQATREITLTIAPANLTRQVFAAVGAARIHTGNDVFDAAFIVQGQPEDNVQFLLSDQRLISLINAIPEVKWTIRNKPIHKSGRLTSRISSDVFTLAGESQDHILDAEQLLDMIEVAKRILQILSEIGLARPCRADKAPS